MSTICMFHKVDNDGYMSAAVVKYFVPDVILKPFNYNMTFPFEEIKSGDVVYFVDVTTSPLEDLLKVQDIVGEGNLIVIDHHKSFIESEVGKRLGTYSDMSLAACELTWLYFSEQDMTSMPRAVRLLGQYDSWRDTKEKQHHGDFSWDTVMAFQYGVRLVPFSVDYLLDRFIYPVRSMANEEIDKTVEKGKMILEYQTNQNKIAMGNSFEHEIRGFKCLCVNTGLRNSQVFASKWDPTKYDFMVAFSYGKDGKWSYSFYTDRDDRDASELAKLFGGGGHAKAAGAFTKDFLFAEDKPNKSLDWSGSVALRYSQHV